MEKLYESLKCCVDQDILEDPVTLPCGHNICLACATSLLNTNRSRNQLICPLDRTIHQYPLGKDSLCVNYGLRDIIANFKPKSDPLDAIKKLIIEKFSSENESLEIINITEVKNTKLLENFERKKKHIKGLNNELVKFHGTTQESGKSIGQNGFFMPTSFKRETGKEGELNFGKAIYLSSFSSKAISYSTGSNPVLLVCKIILGRVSTKKDSEPGLIPEEVHSNGYDSIFCPHQLENSEMNKGTLNDEYAIYDPDQILPLYIVQFKVKGLAEVKEFINYNPKISPKDINFSILFKLLKNGNNLQQKNILMTLGDLCRDYIAESSKAIIQYFEEFREQIVKFLHSKNEILVLSAERVLWNSSFNNRYLQKLIYDGIGFDPLFRIFCDSSYHHIKERTSGIMANLTQLEPDNCNALAQSPKFQSLFKFALLSYEDGKYTICKNLLMTIANVFDRNQDYQSLANCLEPFLDCEQEEIRDQTTKIFSNIIGYTKEWLLEGYKPTEGLKKL